MRFYTSYYANFKNIPSNYICVGISRMCPEGFEGKENFIFVKDNYLAPPKDLIEDMKSGNETEDGYKRRYVKHILETFAPGKKFESFQGFVNKIEEFYKNEYDAVVFLCYERPDAFCHRHILRALMNRIFRIPCEELEVPTKENKNNTASKTQTSLV